LLSAKPKPDSNLATSLARAKTLAEMVELQVALWRKQFGVLTTQVEEVRALSTKVTAAAVEPIKSQIARGAGGHKMNAMTIVKFKGRGVSPHLKLKACPAAGQKS
jgi:hypothetical protein